MKHHQYIGISLLLVGLAITVYSLLGRTTQITANPTPNERSIQPQIVPITTVAPNKPQVTYNDNQLQVAPETSCESKQTPVQDDSQKLEQQPQSNPTVTEMATPTSEADSEVSSLTKPTQVPPIEALVPKEQPVPIQPAGIQKQVHTDATYIDYLVDRALREAEAAALRATESFRKEMMAPVVANDRSFAERLYSIGANAEALRKNEAEYRTYVAERFYNELTKNNNIQANLDVIAFEYLNRLERIAQQTAIESGLDVTNLPTVKFTIRDFDKLLRSDLRESIGPTASEMRYRSLEGTGIQLVSFGVGFLMPTMWVVDLAIGAGIDTTANMFRDPKGDVEIKAHNAVEILADRICFGTDQHQGLYVALLDLAHYHNEQLRETLINSEPISEPGCLEDFFKESDE